jgi:nitrite reductase/ring-hydroxylating ferredoxin subunit
MDTETANALPQLKENEFRTIDVQPGKSKVVNMNGERIAVFNCEGHLYATQERCTHRNGPLHEGMLVGCVIECPWHGSRFDVTTGAVVRGPAREAIKTYQVVVDGDVARVEKHA